MGDQGKTWASLALPVGKCQLEGPAYPVRDLGPDMLVKHVHKGTMDLVGAWTAEADQVLTFQEKSPRLIC